MMPDSVINMFDRRQRIYFIVSSKMGASLSIDYPRGRQGLMLPVYPTSAVEEALHLLEPAFAHYAAQWPKIMVPDPEDTGADGFWVPSKGMPVRIADMAHADELRTIAARHAPQMAAYYGEYFQPLRIEEGSPHVSDDNDDLCVPAEERGIEPWAE